VVLELVYRGGVAKYLQMKLQAAVKKFYPDWALHRDWDRQGLCACANGDSAEIEKHRSCALREEFRFLDKVYWDRGGIWSKGYFVSLSRLSNSLLIVF
jgi:hypothetical protein